MTIFTNAKAAVIGAAIAVAGLSAAQAGTVTDFAIDLDGNYAGGGRDGGLTLAGAYDFFLTDDRDTRRQYSLDVAGSATGLGSFYESLPLGDMLGEFSINDGVGLISSQIPEIAFVVDYLVNHNSGGLPGLFSYQYSVDNYDDSDGTSANGDFTIVLSDNVLPGCGSPAVATLTSIQTTSGGDGQCPSFSGDFSFQVALTYDEEVAPVPLPASLPLLIAGLGGVGAIRRTRKSRA